MPIIAQQPGQLNQGMRIVVSQLTEVIRAPVLEEKLDQGFGCIGDDADSLAQFFDSLVDAPMPDKHAPEELGSDLVSPASAGKIDGLSRAPLLAQEIDGVHEGLTVAGLGKFAKVLDVTLLGERGDPCTVAAELCLRQDAGSVAVCFGQRAQLVNPARGLKNIRHPAGLTITACRAFEFDGLVKALLAGKQVQKPPACRLLTGGKRPPEEGLGKLVEQSPECAIRKGQQVRRVGDMGGQRLPDPFGYRLDSLSIRRVLGQIFSQLVADRLIFVWVGIGDERGYRVAD